MRSAAHGFGEPARREVPDPSVDAAKAWWRSAEDRVEGVWQGLALTGTASSTSGGPSCMLGRPGGRGSDRTPPVGCAGQPESGAPDERCTLGANTRLLIVVDLQVVVAPGGAWEIPGIESVVEATTRLVERHDGPVVASRHIPVPDVVGTTGPFARHADLGELTDDASQLVAPLRHLPSVAKSTYSVYRADGVREAVREAEEVLVCGVETDCCVLATVFDLLDDGVPTVVVPDAVTGPDPRAHDGALRAMARLGDLVRLHTIDELLD